MIAHPSTTARRGVLKAISLALGLLAVGVFCFLSVWYFEVILWLILGPFAVSSLYLAVQLWIVSAAAMRALIWWALSIAWVLALVLGSFKDVTIVGALVAFATTGFIISLVYVSLRAAQRTPSDSVA